MTFAEWVTQAMAAASSEAKVVSLLKFFVENQSREDEEQSKETWDTEFREFGS